MSKPKITIEDVEKQCKTDPSDPLCAFQTEAKREVKKSRKYRTAVADFGNFLLTHVGLAFLICGGLLLFTWVGTAISYQINRGVVDAIEASDVEWWHFFTFFTEEQFYLWLYAHNPGLWWGLLTIELLILFVIVSVLGSMIFDHWN